MRPKKVLSGIRVSLGYYRKPSLQGADLLTAIPLSGTHYASRLLAITMKPIRNENWIHIIFKRVHILIHI